MYFIFFGNVMEKVRLILLSVFLYINFLLVGPVFADGVATQGTANVNQPSFLSTMVQMLPLCIMIYFIFYFFVTRPQEQEKKKQKAMIDTLKKGDDVRTSCGVCGKFQSADDNFIFLEIAQGVKVKFEKRSVIEKI